MTIEKFLDEYRDYLKSVHFKSAKKYRGYLENAYHQIPETKSVLDRMTKEKDHLKQLKNCVQATELIYHAKEKERDPAKRKDYGDSHSAAMKLVDFIQSRVVTIPDDHLTERNISAIFDGRIGTTMKKPCRLPEQGPDQETDHITYKKTVTPDQQIPGLCDFLEQEYECILGFARGIVGNWIDTLHPRRIPVELSKDCPAEIYLNTDEYVTRKINELVKQNKKITVKETKKILRHETPILGLFFEVPYPHIEIYYRQIESSCWEEYKAKIAQVLAHEYMHYLEFARCREHSVDPFFDKRLSEGMADFFGVLYSIKRAKAYDPEIAEKRYDAWVEHFGGNWPYANALYFYKAGKKKMGFSTVFADYVSFGCTQKLMGVFNIIHDSFTAYDRMTK